MKKIITALMFVALSSVSAKAFDMSSFALTGGIKTHSSVFGASGKNHDHDDTSANTIVKTTSGEGVFTETFSSYLIELGIGKYISLGYEHTPDSISTPTNENDGRSGGQKISVDFNDLNTQYVKFNVPGGLYVTYGSMDVDLDIKESEGAFRNVSTSGTRTGIGYERHFGESGFGIRIEGNYLEMDNVSTDDTVTGSVSNNGRNSADVKNLEGLTAGLGLTYTFGRNY